ncbi:MAG: Uncharacterised protein [Formosa sp. Hel1_33_131]|nr:MAG: Uncharacterised protein [Formosa sp. Hel1_33_131]|tara:strand:+ start:1604 stop:2110 length:507 start_codon:yes stop_codon:yes gene_type:complete
MKQNHRLILGIIFLSIFSCKTSKEPVLQLQSTAPFEMVEPYYNAWVGGIESAGSGVNVFLPLKKDLGRVTVDSIHFRGEKSAVVKRDQLLIGRFKYSRVHPKKLIMSSNPHEEYGNTLPSKTDRSPFKLVNNQCVISYRVNDKRLYYKVLNLKSLREIAYPSAPPQKQ